MGSRWLGKRLPRPVARTLFDSRGFFASVAKADRDALSLSEFNKLKTIAETGIDTKFTIMEKVKAEDMN